MNIQKLQTIVDKIHESAEELAKELEERRRNDYHYPDNSHRRYRHSVMGDGRNSNRKEEGMEITVRITREQLLNAREPACGKQVALFDTVFPDGAEWPDDMEKASRSGLNVRWAIAMLKLTGTLRKRYEDGTLRYEEHFVNGKSTDTRYWNENGILRREEHYVNGKYTDLPDGTAAFRQWNEDGTLWYEAHYVNTRTY